jgi:hypothetical protein
MPVNPNSPAKLLDLVISKARDLRAAGVIFVELDKVKFAIAPPPAPDIALPAGTGEERPPSDPFRDPATFGMEGGTPGFGPMADPEPED